MKYYKNNQIKKKYQRAMLKKIENKYIHCTSKAKIDRLKSGPEDCLFRLTKYYKCDQITMDLIKELLSSSELIDPLNKLVDDKKIPEMFIEKNPEMVDWKRLCYDFELSEEFIDKFSNYVDWDIVSSIQTLSTDFIERHKTDVNWHNISAYQELNEDFIIKYEDLIDFNVLQPLSTYSDSFIEKYGEKINWICD